MSRGKTISVKIATRKVIDALEIKLQETKDAYKKQDELEEKYKKVRDKYWKDASALALPHINKAINIRINERYNGILNIDFDLPPGTIELGKEPQRDFETMQDYTYKQVVEEIENAIRILKMTDEEFVNTSTYNSIAKYL